MHHAPCTTRTACRTRLERGLEHHTRIDSSARSLSLSLSPQPCVVQFSSCRRALYAATDLTCSHSTYAACLLAVLCVRLPRRGDSGRDGGPRLATAVRAWRVWGRTRADRSLAPAACTSLLDVLCEPSFRRLCAPQAFVCSVSLVDVSIWDCCACVFGPPNQGFPPHRALLPMPHLPLTPRGARG